MTTSEFDLHFAITCKDSVDVARRCAERILVLLDEADRLLPDDAIEDVALTFGEFTIRGTDS